MTTVRVDRVHEQLLDRGWAVTNSATLGLDHVALRASLEPSLVADPRGPGKQHARDVIAWEWEPEPGGGQRLHVAEADSITHGATDDFSRFWLLAAHGNHGLDAAKAVLGLVPPSMRRAQGFMSADLFRYTPGTSSSAHQDKFGDLIVIWVLHRSGPGAESYLLNYDGTGAYRGTLSTGSILVFRDDLFLHGVTTLAAGIRDALIFITLRD